MKQRTVQLEQMRPEEIAQARARADVAFLPVGTLEWHGLQSPVGTDGIKAHHVACEAAKHLGGGVVAPAWVLGVPRDSFDVGRIERAEPVIADALETDVQTLRGAGRHGGADRQSQWLIYQQVARMTLEQLAGFGFSSIYIVCGHQPLIHWVRPVGIAFARDTVMSGRPVTVDWGGEFEAAGLSGDHGGKWETSLMMAADPDNVDLSRLEERPEACGVAHGKDAVDATTEQGRAWLTACGRAIAEEARWLVEHYPKLPARHQHKR